MTKVTKPITKQEMEQAKKKLATARNHYDNELLKVEKLWAKLKTQDYVQRKSLIKVMSDMTEIDQSLRTWENKLNGQS